MNIDFHFGIVYIVARLAGMEPASARTVAHACQYVDDATTSGVLAFRSGETFERFASAHTLHDYHNIENTLNRLVWAPFHFVPAGEGESVESRAICRPDSAIARDVVRHAIDRAGEPNALHRLGVALHAYVDTWAHQGFSGIRSDVNRVRHLEAHDCTPKQWRQWFEEIVTRVIGHAEIDVVSRFFPLGHGAALHYPDMPWAKWTYTNGLGERIARDNLPDFVAAAEMACRVVRGFLARDRQFDKLPGLPDDARAAIEHLLGTNHDADCDRRLARLGEHLEAGDIPGVSGGLPVYIAKGKGSWKHMATGLLTDDDGHTEPEYLGKVFEESDYRYFHDAVKEHRFVVTQQVLPAVGLRIA